MYNSSFPINIHKKDQELTFNKGKYYMDIIGGWHIRLNGFILILANSDTDELVYPKNSFPVQSMYGTVHGRRVFDFEVPQKGTYQLKFQHPYNLVIKKPSLFLPRWILSLFTKMEVDNEQIEVVIYRK